MQRTRPSQASHHQETRETVGTKVEPRNNSELEASSIHTTLLPSPEWRPGLKCTREENRRQNVVFIGTALERRPARVPPSRQRLATETHDACVEGTSVGHFVTTIHRAARLTARSNLNSTCSSSRAPPGDHRTMNLPPNDKRTELPSIAP